ncbi:MULTISPECIES: outer membrane beta-barrel protein [unclassified Roseibium]|uniref:outer membrane beta-barrel protein n=1 Tax=unclassified Roseibium TaxID=2629323 RepID=UPI000925F042|nr:MULTISPECIES: outer membrane beta-barrel protein [unclassified Roseibium]OJJ10091.1 hypothetical protein BKI51_15930 [Alphaproteobacteria bacterium AO1-B]
MTRFLTCIICFALSLALAEPSFAQTAVPGLRGSDDPGRVNAADDDGREEAETPAGVNPTQSNVFALRPSVNIAEEEDGSTGLGAAGRVQPVRPFSDRITAVTRAVPLAQGGIDDTVFGGDTTFDAPDGIRLGSFILTPQLTVTAGYTDNTSRSATGGAGSLYRIAPDISLTSDWVRHQFDASLRGSYIGYPGNPDDDDIFGSAAAGLRLDITEATRVDADISYGISREEDGSAESLGNDTFIHEGNIDLGVTRNVGLLAATAAVGADRRVYDSDSTIESGRDNTVYSASLRLGSNAGGLLSPFAQGSLLFRRFDQTCSDSICEIRDADGYELRGGLAIAAGPKLVGEVSAGWRLEDIEDSRLKNLSGLVIDGSLVWSPSRLTTVTAGVGTSFDATDIDNASGSIIYSGDLRLAHAFSDRWVGEAGLGYSYRTYEGVSIEENTLTGFGGMTYALTQNVALTANYIHRRFESSQDGGDYTENAIEAGLRFRH